MFARGAFGTGTYGIADDELARFREAVRAGQRSLSSRYASEVLLEGHAPYYALSSARGKAFPASSLRRAYSEISRVRHTRSRRLCANPPGQPADRISATSEMPTRAKPASTREPSARGTPTVHRSDPDHEEHRRPDHQAELETAKHRAARLVGAARPERVAAVERELEGPDENEREHERRRRIREQVPRAPVAASLPRPAGPGRRRGPRASTPPFRRERPG